MSENWEVGTRASPSGTSEKGVKSIANGSLIWVLDMEEVEGMHRDVRRT